MKWKWARDAYDTTERKEGTNEERLTTNHQREMKDGKRLKLEISKDEKERKMDCCSCSREREIKSYSNSDVSTPAFLRYLRDFFLASGELVE